MMFEFQLLTGWEFLTDWMLKYSYETREPGSVEMTRALVNKVRSDMFKCRRQSKLVMQAL